MELPEGPIRLNVGSGMKRYQGWLNVDLVGDFDIYADCREIPVEDGSVDSIMAIHVLEHLPVWEGPVALAEWARVLKHGGKLVIELPERSRVFKLCKKDPAQALAAMYGPVEHRSELMMHRWLYEQDELVQMVTDAGFAEVVVKSPQLHGKRLHRDIRIEARRK